MPYKPKSHWMRLQLPKPIEKEKRPSAAARGYGHRWRQIRALFLKRNPMCVVEGCGGIATEVDHIIARGKEGSHEGWANLQALCKTHHSQKTAREDGSFGREKT